MATRTSPEHRAIDWRQTLIGQPVHYFDTRARDGHVPRAGVITGLSDRGDLVFNVAVLADKILDIDEGAIPLWNRPEVLLLGAEDERPAGVRDFARVVRGSLGEAMRDAYLDGADLTATLTVRATRMKPAASPAPGTAPIDEHGDLADDEPEDEGPLQITSELDEDGDPKPDETAFQPAEKPKGQGPPPADVQDDDEEPAKPATPTRRGRRRSASAKGGGATAAASKGESSEAVGAAPTTVAALPPRSDQGPIRELLKDKSLTSMAAQSFVSWGIEENGAGMRGIPIIHETPHDTLVEIAVRDGVFWSVYRGPDGELSELGIRTPLNREGLRQQIIMAVKAGKIARQSGRDWEACWAGVQALLHQ